MTCGVLVGEDRRGGKEGGGGGRERGREGGGERSDAWSCISETFVYTVVWYSLHPFVYNHWGRDRY